MTEQDHDVLMDQLITAVVVLDPQLRIAHMNSAAESLFDGSSKRLLSTPFISHFRYLSLSENLLHHALEQQQSVSDSEVELVLHDGQRMLVELTAQPMQAPSTWQGQLIIELRRVDQVRRISQETTQQQQRHAAQALVRGLAHEIKNPLGGIRGAAQLLSSEVDPRFHEYTDIIIRQSDRLRGLVDRLLGPRQLPQEQSVNIHEVLERVLNVVRAEHGDHQLAIVRDYDPSLPNLTLVVDSIEQALLNIVLNAVQAMRGKGTLTLRSRVLHQQTIYAKRYRQCAVISIIDTGPGVADELRETLFYPMVSGREGGTGLGLALAQTALHQHAGKIELESRPGFTEFRVFIPYLESRVTDEVRRD